jgi:iron complex transport system substrate-binding protein
MTQPRIVSLIASATEIVAGLGFGSCLVGRSHECDFPAEVLELPVCSEPKIDVNGTSREIDQRVKSLVGEAISVYRVFPEILRRLAPTHIVTQTQCEVCAVSLKDVEEAMGQLIGSRPTIVSLAPVRLDDLWKDIGVVAASLEAEERAETLVRRLRAEIDKTAMRARTASARPTIACIEWIDPLMAAGNWVPELVELAGGTNVVGTAGRHSPWLTLAEVVARDPDIIAVMPCGFDIPRTRHEMPPLTADPRWAELRAVRQGQVFLCDGIQFFNRPGPRLVESARILAEILHPELFDNSLEGSGWVRYGGRPTVCNTAAV